MPIPVVTSAATATATVGAAFTFQVTASNAPTAFKAEFLPPQLQINPATGQIWGTAEVSGTFGVKLYASNASGTSDAFTLTITVAPTAAQTGSTLAPVPPSTAANATTVGGQQRASQGNYQTLPTPTTNGAEVSNRPAYTSALQYFMPAGSTFTHFIANTGTSPTGPANGQQLKLTASGVDVVDFIYLSGTDSVFVTDATNGTGTGNPPIRVKWVQRG